MYNEFSLEHLQYNGRNIPSGPSEEETRDREKGKEWRRLIEKSK